MANYLTPEQFEQLLRPINPSRVGTDGKGFSHVEAYEIRAHLIRIFGPARWSQEVVSQDLVFEQSEERERKGGGKYMAWTVCYRSVVRLSVNATDGTLLATYTEGATGEATNQPSRGDAHDLSLKTSQSQALKRCAYNLGDQFGLGLFAKGSKAALVKRSLVLPVGVAPEAFPQTAPVDAHITEPLPAESEQVEDKREKNAPKAAEQPREDTRRPVVDALRERALNPPADVNAQWWARLQLDATKAKVLNAKTADAQGVEMTLAALIQGQMRRVAA